MASSGGSGSAAITRVEHELWNIFTYYTLHSDPTQPEHLKVAHFIRFVKDCQIVSKHLIEADIQIMMTREVRNKRLARGDDGSAGYITFYDFVSLLNMLAPKVSPLSFPLSPPRLILPTGLS
jgi:hypothetical protein